MDLYQKVVSIKLNKEWSVDLLSDPPFELFRVFKKRLTTYQLDTYCLLNLKRLSLSIPSTAFQIGQVTDFTVGRCPAPADRYETPKSP